jgi:adenylate cyclase
MGSQEHRVERRLAAILAADVAGYSRLMEKDEVGTLQTLTAYRQIMDRLIAEHGGRIANTAGDSVLVEFGSVVDAIQCSVAVQGQLEEANANTLESHRLQFRIGVHLGDVMAQGADILGDAVNISARLQSLAEPGGICISGAAHDHVRKVVRLTYADLGPQAVKNIEEPIRAYLVGPARLSETAPPDPGQHFRRLPLPEKPSMAVLPFANLSGDPEQEYLADGITEEILTALAKVRWFFVIAGSSSFTFKGRAVDAKQVGRDLGVRYVLEGSIRKAGNRLRITGQLIEAETGNHLWADRYEGLLEDVFDLQDRITENVVAAIEPQLRFAEIERSKSKRPENLTAHDRFLRALSQFYLASREGMAATLRLLEETIKLDPDYGPPYALAAQCYVYYITQGWTDDPTRDRTEGARLARAAVERDRDEPTLLWMAGHALAFLGNHDHEAALALLDRSIALNPNSAAAYCFSAWSRCYAGYPEVAVQQLHAALRLSPVDRHIFMFQSALGVAYCMSGQHEKAVEWSQKAVSERPNWTGGYRPLVSSLAHLGRMDEACVAMRRLLEIDPTYRIDFNKRVFRPSEGREILISGLRLAGAPE